MNILWFVISIIFLLHLLNGTHLFWISSSTVLLGHMQPSVVPEQDGFGSLQVGTQSGALSEYTWPSAVQVCSVMIQI